jgi:two-component system chemotaxis response regulator CheY
MRSILSVDDSKAIRDMIAFTLEPKGFRVVHAADGAEGLARVKAEAFALIITDLNMPVMNGFEFIENARKHPNGSGVPIVMLTTESKPEMKAKGKAAGATGWLSKPFDADTLVAVAKKLIG